MKKDILNFLILISFLCLGLVSCVVEEESSFSTTETTTDGYSSGEDIVGIWTCTRRTIESSCESSSIYSADSNGISYTASGTLTLTDNGDGTYSWNSSFSLQGQCHMSDQTSTQTRDYDVVDGNTLFLSANSTSRNAGSSSKSERI